MLPVPYVSQGSARYLCWAACAEMLFRYIRSLNPAFEIRTTICELAGINSGRDCCGRFEPPCDRPGWPHELYRFLNFPYLAEDGPLPFEMLVEELRTHRLPVQVYFRGLAHTALVVGVFSDGDLAILDPLFGRGKFPYRELVIAYGRGGQWTRTWYRLGIAHGPN